MSDLKRLQEQLRQARLARTDAERRAIETRSKKSSGKERATATANKNAAVAAESALHDQLAALPDPRELVEQLDDRVPFVLFPIRIETRFKELRRGHELWLRFYPDDCQVQTYTDFVSVAELGSVTSFWVDYTKAGGHEDQERAAWRGLVAAHGSGRAAFLIERVAPQSAGPTKAAPEDVILVVRPTAVLTAPERAAAETYWEGYWRAGRDAHARRAAEDALVAAIGAEAAGRIRADFRPDNIDDAPLPPHERGDVAVSLVTLELQAAESTATTESSWNAAPRVTTLPDRFVVTGLRKNEVVFQQVGAPIPPTLAVGPDPSLPESEQMKSVDGELSVNEDLRWLTDFDRAVAKGMGMRVSLTETQYQQGFDQLFVLGLRLSSDALDGADMLEALLRDHQRSKSGFSLLPQGTPTNNTDDVQSGYTWTDDPDASFDRVLGHAADAPSGDPSLPSDGAVLAEALGIDVDVLARAPYADGRDQAEARAMNTALWPATWGYFLGTMLGEAVSDDWIEQARTFFVRHVSGRGAVPAFRVGKQPYGVLPATVRSRFDPTSGGRSRTWSPELLTELHGWLERLDGAFREHLPTVAHVGMASEDPHQVLLDVLGLHATSVEYYQRWVQPLEEKYNEILYQSQDAEVAGMFLLKYRLFTNGILGAIGIDPETELPILDNILHDDVKRMRGAVVGGLSETQRLPPHASDGRSYLRWLATAPFDELRRQDFGGPSPPRTLLYLIARHALLACYRRTGLGLLAAADLVDPRTVRKEPVFQHVDAAIDDASPWLPLITAAPEVTGDPTLTLAEHLDQAMSAHSLIDTVRLREVREALLMLDEATTAALERLFAEHVDLCSYRLDAWKLGFVHYRLAQQRAVRPRGAYLGGFGWLEDVRPENKPLTGVQLPEPLAAVFDDPAKPGLVRDGNNGGFIHAPSIDHAAAAAVLRNGFLTHATPSSPTPMSVNLSSARVRAAERLLQGITRGQRLSELLGYQFERGLHDSHGLGGPEVERFMLALRRKFPLVANKHELTKLSTIGSIHGVEARNVIDGLALLKHVRQTKNAHYPFGLSTGTGEDDLPVATTAEAAAIDAEVDRLADSNDAVADLMLAESVYQLLRGQTERAGAATDVIGRGARPHEAEVVRTPRGGTTLVHRVCVHFDAEAGVPAGATPRASAEPAIDAWLAARFPDPSKVACRASWAAPDGGQGEATVTQAELGLAAIDVLHLAAFESEASQGELDDRIDRHVRATVARHPGATVEIRYTAPIPGMVSFFELGALVRHLRPLVLGGRAIGASDMMRPNDAGTREPAWDLDELAGRIETAKDALATRAGAVDALAADTSTAVEEYLDLATDELLLLRMHGVARTGTGDFRARLGRVFEDTSEKARTVVERWKQQRARYDDLLASIEPAMSDAMVISTLAKAEAQVSSEATEPRPATAAEYHAIVSAKRSTFDSALAAFEAQLVAPVARLRSFLDGLEPLVVSMGAHDPVWFDIERESNDLSAERAALDAMRDDVRNRLLAAKADAAASVATAEALLLKAAGEAEIAPAARAYDQAARKVLGDEARVLPRFVLLEDADAEIRSAISGSDALFDHLRAAGRDFPVDDWLYGLARVRQPLWHWSQSAALVEALGRESVELVPLQLPFLEGDSWTALELAEGYDLSSEKLLYTAGLAVLPTEGARWTGIVLDEWTEVVPTKEETTGVAFHFDQPNTEPPQVVLLATPPALTGKWRWQDLLDTLRETLHEAKMRAIEPAHVAETFYSQFLPATLFSATSSPLSLSTNLALNNIFEALTTQKVTD